jgi:RNA polymerase-binding transcription factor DksA
MPFDMAKKPVKKAVAKKPVKKVAKKAASKPAPKAVKKSAPAKKASAKKAPAKKAPAKKAVSSKKSTPVKKPKAQAVKKTASGKTGKPSANKTAVKAPKNLPIKAKKPTPTSAPVKPAASSKSAAVAKKSASAKPTVAAPAKSVKSAPEKSSAKTIVVKKSLPESKPKAKVSAGNPIPAPPPASAAKAKSSIKPTTKPVSGKSRDMDDEDPNQGFTPYIPPPEQPEPVIDKSGWLTRTKFTDAELQDFRDIIKRKLNKAVSDYELLKDTISHRDNNGTDDTSPTFKLLEDGSEVMSKEETTQLALRQQKYIQALENALIRIENKTYGICRATGQMISKERLKSVPHATLSIEAKKSQQD